MARFVYAVQIQIRTDQPLSAERLNAVQGGTWEIVASGHPRGRTLNVTMMMESSDVAGALTRALNVVLDQVPGKVLHAEVDETGPRIPQRRRRSRMS